MKKDIYKTIKAPHITEKVTNLMNQSNQYAFKVDINSTKKEIKKAVEAYFSVEVNKVRVLNKILFARWQNIKFFTLI